MREISAFVRRSFVLSHFLTASLTLAVVSLSLSPSSAQTPFVPTTVDTISGGGGGDLAGTSVAIDARGDVHVAYLVNPADNLFEVWYARRSGSTWTTEMVDAVMHVQVGANALQFPSLAVESDGTPHVTYKDTPGFPFVLATDVIHAEKVGGAWVMTAIDVVGGGGGFVSVALDPTGAAHVSYYDDAATGVLYYAAESDAFTPEVVSSGAAGKSNCIAIADPFGDRALISYFDGADLFYASHLSGTGWTLTLVDAGPAGSDFGTSLALDAKGDAHISYVDITGGLVSYDLFYATNTTGAWVSGVVDAAVVGSPGIFNDVVIDATGNPHISYTGLLLGGLRYASRAAGVWTIETVTVTGHAGTSLAFDIHGNPHATHGGDGTPGLILSDAGVHLVAPEGGETWPVGGERTITWSGQGLVNLELSVDGGNTYEQIAAALSGVVGGSHTLRVPHTPSRFCLVKVARVAPFSEEECDSFLTIETSIDLLSFTIELDENRGAFLSWNTDPGPADLGGYRLEKQRGGRAWVTLVAFTRSTSYNDNAGTPGDRYRLYAINGLGEELYMGETGSAPGFTEGLALWPMPYRSGDLHVRFATASALGGGGAPAEVAVYDVAGRLVTRILSGRYPAGVHTATWDGRNEEGEPLASGVYLVRLMSAGEHLSRKLVIVR